MSADIQSFVHKQTFIKKEALYAWIEAYKAFLCSNIKYPEGEPDHSAAVLRSLEYMGVIESMAKKLEEQEHLIETLNKVISELSEHLQRRIESPTIDLK